MRVDAARFEFGRSRWVDSLGEHPIKLALAKPRTHPAAQRVGAGDMTVRPVEIHDAKVIVAFGTHQDKDLRPRQDKDLRRVVPSG